MPITFELEIPLNRSTKQGVEVGILEMNKKNWENNTPVYFLPYPVFITGMSGDLFSCKHMNTAINTFL